MKTLNRFLVFTAVACFSASLFADQITLKNGDRISGKIQKSDGKNIVIKTEFAGDVTIVWSAVTAINSDDALNIDLADGQHVVGTIKTSEATLQIATKDAGQVNAPLAAVKTLRNKEQEEAHKQEVDRFRNPRLVDLWAGFLDLGYAKASGNAETSTINVSANANRATSRDKIGVYFTSIYASNTTAGKAVTSANAIRGGINYNLNVSKKMFAFGGTDLEFDEFQKLDLRFAPSGGFGFHAVNNAKTILDISGGAGLNREFFSTGLQRTSAEILLGEELTHKFTKTTSLHEKLTFLPNVSDSGAYRMNFDVGLATSIKKWLSWQLSYSNRYLSNPVPGRNKSDNLFTTGVRVTFAK